jgi:predicted dienelactone hydrolase
MSAVLDHLLAGDPGWPAIDPRRIASLGHSFGGWTAIKLACRDPRIRAVCGLAPASEPFVGRKAFEPGELPLAQDRPVLLIAGMNDVLVDVGTSVRPLFARMADPRALIGVAQTDHFHFCDGVELLHGMHVANPRENQTQPTAAYAELLSEERIHRILNGLVASFFSTVFAGRSDACDQFDAEDLARFDPCVAKLADEASASQQQRRTG